MFAHLATPFTLRGTTFRNRIFSSGHQTLLARTGAALIVGEAVAVHLVAAGGIITVQVLNEFASVASRKFGMLWAEIRDVLETVRAVCRVEPLGLEAHEPGLALAERYGFSVDDAMILASAQLADCRVVFTEDLQRRQMIDERLEIISPLSKG